MKNVGFRFKNKWILEKFNVLIQSEKITGVTGDGKTKLLELIDGIYLPKCGEILLDGEMLTSKNKREIEKIVSLVSQSAKDSFYTSTLKEEMTFISKSLKLESKNIEKRIYQALKIVGLKDSVIMQSFETLSSGEKKLAQLAIALFTNPKVLLLDEPFVELDYDHKKILLKLIRQLKIKYRKTIIIATNDQDLLYSLADDILVLKEGKLVRTDTATKLYKDIEFLEKYDLDIPKLVQFTYKAKEKNVKLMFHKDIKDLIKDIYKHV